MKAILRVLRDCGGYMLPEDRLLDEVRIQRGSCLRGEFKAALDELEARGWAVAVRNELHGVRWKISDLGKATLTE